MKQILPHKNECRNFSEEGAAVDVDPGNVSGKMKEAGSGVYHGNVQSKVFHRKGCRHFNCQNCTNNYRKIEN